MNPAKSNSFILGLLAAFFALTFAAGCGNKKSEKKEATGTEKNRMDTGNVRPIVPATVAPPAN